LDWNGGLVWWYQHISKYHCLHNDIEPLPNGNILMISWEHINDTDADNAGRDPSIDDGDMLIDYIIEVDPTSPGQGNIVWEWHAWNHLIQDKYPAKQNYGVVSANPELIDINIPRIGESSGVKDFLHMNSLEYIEEFDQILVSLRNINEIIVIDHSTTKAQAAGHTGGNSGKGGDLLYRWGNPMNYDRGSETDQQLFRQHDARLIQSDCPGAGHFTIFNNGWIEGWEPKFSTAIEIVPPIDTHGNYYLEPGHPYGPTAPVWKYESTGEEVFYSQMCGGVQRLPNGNTLICEGWKDGRIFEVTPQGEIIWCYTNLAPWPGIEQTLFKMQRYPIDYPGIGDLEEEAVQYITEMEYIYANNPFYLESDLEPEMVEP
jgi:hypothetical protein